jgi:DNA-binding transcriptional LysR family regulator
MNLLQSLATYVRVVETGSFSAVAREANSSQSSVTRAVEQLEQHFGMRLLHRTTRRLCLTDDGESLLAHARGLLASAEEMEATLGHRKSLPTGRVRVGLQPELGFLVTSRLDMLLGRYPGLCVEMVTGERFGDMVEERLDLVIQNGLSGCASAVARAVATFRRVAVAAPTYLEGGGILREPEDLVRHRCIVHETGPDSDLWRFTGPTGPVDVRVAGSLRANSSEMVHKAALTGYGIACLLEPHVLDDIHAGRLCRVLPQYRPEQEQSFLIYPSRRHVPPRTRVLIDLFVSAGREAEAVFAQAHAPADDDASRAGRLLAA